MAKANSKNIIKHPIHYSVYHPELKRVNYHHQERFKFPPPEIPCILLEGSAHNQYIRTTKVKPAQKEISGKKGVTLPMRERCHVIMYKLANIGKDKICQKEKQVIPLTLETS